MLINLIPLAERLIAECHPYFWETIDIFITTGGESTHELLSSLAGISNPDMWQMAGDYFRSLLDKLWPDKDTEVLETLQVFASEMARKTGMVLEKVSC